MSSIYLIDYYSNTIKSVIHRVTVVSKTIFLLLVLLSIVVSKSFSSLFLILFIIIVLIMMAKLPVLKILKWSLYPAFFASLFAISQIQYGLLPLQTMLRAIDAVLLTLLIVCTTPYPAFFSLVSRVSIILANVFFTAYRYFFLVVDEIQTKIRVMKVRGGYIGGPIKILKNIGLLIGRLFIHSIERSERLYDIMVVRGYQGVVFSRISLKFGLADLLFIAIGIVILVATIFNVFAF